MVEWHAPVSEFAKANRYTFFGDLAFCTVKAQTNGTVVELWISNMGTGRQRATVGGTLSAFGVVHCRAKAKLVADIDLVVRRKTIFDRIISRGQPLGDAEFDARYIALGKPADVRRVLTAAAVQAFVGMWQWTEGLCVEDGEVTLEGGQFAIDPAGLSLIIDTVGTIASCGAR